MDNLETPVEAPLDKAIRLLGSQSAVGKACGKKQQHVWNWLRKNGGRVPPHEATAIERAIDALGGTERVTRRELCPDFPWDDLERPPLRAATSAAAV